MAAGGSRSMIMEITESNENIHAGQAFHERCGRRITLSNGNRTATRSIRDFSHALVFSAEPLVDDILFEVVIEQKNLSWGGSIEIGVTTECPDRLDLPSCATVMRNGTWVMSGIDVRKDGMCLTEFYGTDLEMLNENDRVGVMRTSNNELFFYVNGESQGLAATNMPKKLWALVDLYGRCVQVSIYPNETIETIGDGLLNEELNDSQFIGNIDLPNCMDVNIDNANICNNNNNNSMLRQNSNDVNEFNANTSMANSGIYSSPISNAIASSTCSSIGDCYDINDHLRFHTRCGSLVKLSRNCRTAERCRPLDEFNNGVVMTHRPLRDNEMFEIRIDKLVDKWSGSIEVGVTTHNPSILHFPATMTNMRSGTIMMSGCGILTNGKGTRRQYGDFNLDELREGDRVGMMRKSSGNLYYYINGQDQGVAATRVAATLWGVIDLYGMTTKVTIVDLDEREQQNLITRRNNNSNLFSQNSNIINDQHNHFENEQNCDLLPDRVSISNEFASEMEIADTSDHAPEAPISNTNVLTFHPICGSHATITNNGKTALRPNASEDFNNGVVLTQRPLYNNELFQVRLERVVTKWAGSVEIGVTTFCAEDLDFPFTMTNVRSGTWMMTGNGVMQNGVTIVEQYGENLDRLQVGDRVGVIRKENGILHFLVNGVDQGPAASNIPETVYGVIDLYGQAAQASIVDNADCDSPDTGNSTISNTTLYSDTPLKFHEIHGKNVIITNNGLTASRPNSLAEFNNAIVFSNRPLKQRELFEIVIDTVIRHWSGNIEIGVTGCRPDDIFLSANATELDAVDTIILCGPLLLHNRKKIRSNVMTDIDTLKAGSHIGVMRNGDFIHFYINGIDQGAAAECQSPCIWAIVDLYGQCAQVTIQHSPASDLRAPYATSENSQSYQVTSIIQPGIQQNKHRWTCISGNVILNENCTMAVRTMNNTGALSRCLLFSEHQLVVGTPFEMKVVSYNQRFAGCFSIGVSDVNLSDYTVRRNVPFTIRSIPANIWYINGNEIRQNSQLLRLANVSLDWLRVGDCVSLELTPTRTINVLFNSEDVNIQFSNVSNNVYVIVELQGSTMGVQTISSPQVASSPLRPCSLRLQDSIEFSNDPLQKQDSMLESIDSETLSYEFSELCGTNICLLENRRSAQRQQSYNNGLVFIPKPLFKGDSISIKIDTINPAWKGTMGLGVLGVCPQASNTPLPSTILQCKRPCWVTTQDYININGVKSMSKYGDILEHVQAGTVITMTLTLTGMLVITVGSTSLEDLASGILSRVYPVFDVYGKCERISIICGQAAGITDSPAAETSCCALEQGAAQAAPDVNTRQCEKADLEVHEKEFELQPSTSNEVSST